MKKDIKTYYYTKTTVEVCIIYRYYDKKLITHLQAIYYIIQFLDNLLNKLEYK
jgi:hypothetical protein